jgi:hypothetical protein
MQQFALSPWVLLDWRRFIGGFFKCQASMKISLPLLDQFFA